MSQAYIVDAVRTPVGRRGGGLSQVHPVDMAAHVIEALISRSGLEPPAVDDVIFGCIDRVGPQAGNVARMAWLGAGFSDEVPGTVIDRNCGSSQQAVHFAAQAIMSGTQDIVVAGGVQNMSQIPIGFAATAAEVIGCPDPYSGSTAWVRRYGGEGVSQFRGAELIAEHWDISRAEMEALAYESHVRSIRAIDEGRFAHETVTLGDLTVDECPRRDSSLERMAALPTLTPGGRLTAAVSSQICDGASAMLIASERALEQFGLTPRARIHHISVRATDPVYMLTGPIPATKFALGRAGMDLSEIDLFEVNEAFAPVVIAWLRETGVDPVKVNVNGGAIALGHAIGNSGARLMTTLLHELERTQARYGLQTMCEGGGQANVTIIERCT